MLILFLASSSPGKMQQSRDVNMALVLISTVAMFVLCHTPRWENKFGEKDICVKMIGRVIKLVDQQL